MDWCIQQKNLVYPPLTTGKGKFCLGESPPPHRGGGASKFGLFLPHDGGLCSPPQSGQGSEGISTLVLSFVSVTLTYSNSHTV